MSKSKPDQMTRPPTVVIKKDPDKSEARQFAEVGLSPIVASAQTARLFVAGTMDVDLNEAVSVLATRATRAKTGDLGEAEEMLMAQAASLDAIYNSLARRASSNMGEYLPALEIYLRLALKAQSQCRTTLETLAEMKYPRPVAFVKQANIAAGPQQVNNGVTTGDARTGKRESQPNELLESKHGERMDPKASRESVATNPPLAAVGKVNRANK